MVMIRVPVSPRKQSKNAVFLDSLPLYTILLLLYFTKKKHTQEITLQQSEIGNILSASLHSNRGSKQWLW